MRITPLPAPLPRPIPGVTVRRLRRRLGGTQVQLAMALGVHANNVARWERDEVPIQPHFARLLQHLAATQRPTPARRVRRAR
jgi:transcriptional regulator with XRE-family HTH domain